jgi:hypothetical protein
MRNGDDRVLHSIVVAIGNQAIGTELTVQRRPLIGRLSAGSKYSGMM